MELENALLDLELITQRLVFRRGQFLILALVNELIGFGGVTITSAGISQL